MREDIETLFAMICRHSRVANTTKRHILVSDVHNNIVQAGTSRRCTVQHLFALIGRAEIVESKRFFTLCNEFYRLLCIGEGQDIMIIIMGLVVGTLFIAVYSPMLSIMGTLGA